jgi:hypothetical protein
MCGATITLLFTFFTFLIMSDAESRSENMVLNPCEYSGDSDECRTLKEFLEYGKSQQALEIHNRISETSHNTQGVLEGKVSIKDIWSNVRGHVKLGNKTRDGLPISNNDRNGFLKKRLVSAMDAIDLYNELVEAEKLEAADTLLDTPWGHGLSSAVIGSLSEEQIISSLEMHIQASLPDENAVSTGSEDEDIE